MENTTTKESLKSMSLENLRVLYFENDNNTFAGKRKQDAIVKTVLKQFEGLVYKEVGKKSNFVNSYDHEDWKSIIETAIWEGFAKKEGQEVVLFDIVSSVQSVISQKTQILTAQKRGYFQETAVDFLEDVAVHETVNYTTQWINNIEIKRVLDKMPEKKRIVIEYFLEGYPVLSNKWNEPQVGPCIKAFTGMQDCTIYNWINDFIKEAQQEMAVPKELEGQSLSGIAYNIEKTVGKKRQYAVIVDEEGNEMFTKSYYSMKQKRKRKQKR